MRRAETCLALAAAACAACSEPGDPALIVLAIDGMDPGLLRRFIAEGRTPNLERLAESGGLTTLETSTPPQSPVAWSHFITGHDSDVHGIYDFVHRDPETMAPYLSTSKVEGPAYVLDLGRVQLPFGGGVELLRRGRPFWSDLADRGLDATVLRIPASYPPVEPSPARVLSGMGTPDLLGTPGLFQVLTTDRELLAKKDVSGGRIHLLEIVAPAEATGALHGPPDPLSLDGRPMTAQVSIFFGHRGDSALVRVAGAEVLLLEGEWSEWLEVTFEPMVDALAITGMVRVFAKSLGATPTLYFSPVNLDPRDPAQPISSPEGLAREIAGSVGRFYTQGMPEDTKALIAGVLTEQEFLDQSELVFEEREAILQRELERFESGFLFFYFSSVDLVSHMFWRSLDPRAPEADRAFAHVIPDLYAKVDGVVGEVMDRLGGDTTILVMSDHGFAPYHTKVHLNTWLARKGYLALRPEDDRSAAVLGHVDWARTRAYALGLNQLFLNLEGREPEGTVAPGEAPWLLEEIARELEAFTDPRTGRRVVDRVFRPGGESFADRAPDLIIGYARGYRSSDESALGRVGTRTLEENRGKWSGDHCMDPRHVPGVLLANRTIREGEWSLEDVAPTIRAYFDADRASARRSFLGRDRE